MTNLVLNRTPLFLSLRHTLHQTVKPRHLELLLYKTYADLRSEAARTYVSFLWWLIEPLLFMGGFYVVFGLIFQRGTEDFAVFLLIGTVTWKWFASSLSRASGSLLIQAPLIKQLYIPKFIVPTVCVLTDSFKFLIALVLLLTFLLVYGIPITTSWFAVPLLVLIQLLLITGISYLTAALVPFLPDLRILIDSSLMILFFLSGVFYGVNIIPEAYQPYFFLNPMAGLIDSYRGALLYHVWPDLSRLVLISSAGLTMMLLGGLLLRRYDRVYPKIL